MKSFLKYVLATIVGLLLSGLLLFVIMIGLITGIASTADKEIKIEKNTVLNLRLNKPISDRDPENPFDGIEVFGPFAKSETGLNKIIRNIRKAKTDDNIKGIVINTASIRAGYAQVEEIRQALDDFKESGKFVYSYSGNYSQLSYYLASNADSVFANPQGIIDLRGMSIENLYFKNLLDQIGVEMQVFRGKNNIYKSAVEPYSLDEMSEDARQENTALLNSIWSKVSSDIAADRGINGNAVQVACDNFYGFSDISKLVEHNLIDGLWYSDEFERFLKDRLGLDGEDEINMVELNAYDKVRGERIGGYKKDKIAVIYAEGDIDLPGKDYIDSRNLMGEIRKARKDTAIKAIVLRVNSPGGSSYGSELIWREVSLAKEEKPVIISMGNYAASGGYYISAPADTILANSATITGSIGIFAMIPNMGGLLNDKLGITVDGVGTNELSDFVSLERPLTTFEKTMIQNYVDKGYDLFLTRCANGRNLDKSYINEIGRGRVWSGEQSTEIGLVDKIGSLNDAVELAARMAKVDEYNVKELPELQDPIEKLISELSGNVKLTLAEDLFGNKVKYFVELKRISTFSPFQARLPFTYYLH